MEPMLYDGDLVLLDRRKSDLRNGGIYGIVDMEGDVRIKRIEQIEDGIILRSENPEGLTELRFAEDANRVRIIGSLVWSSHSYAQKRPRSKEPLRFKPDWF